MRVIHSSIRSVKLYKNNIRKEDVMTKRKSKEDFEEQGRPTEYTDEIADFICDLIASHSLSVAKLIERYDLPSKEAITLWLTKHPYFMTKYVIAKRMQAIVMTDEILDLAECQTYVDEKGVTRADSGMIQIAKMKIEQRRWQAVCLAPKIFATRNVDEKVDAIHAEVMAQRKERDKQNEKDF